MSALAFELASSTCWPNVASIRDFSACTCSQNGAKMKSKWSQNEVKVEEKPREIEGLEGDGRKLEGNRGEIEGKTNL